MARKAKQIAQEAKATKAKKEGKDTALTVTDQNGRYIRTYTLALHGEGFKQSAEVFAQKIRGKLRKATEDEEKGEEGRPQREYQARQAELRRQRRKRGEPEIVPEDHEERKRKAWSAKKRRLINRGKIKEEEI